MASPMLNVYTGKTGTLSLLASKTVDNAVETIGPQEILDAAPIFKTYGLGKDIARVTNVEVHVDTGLEEFHQIGKRFAVSLNPGDIHVHGRIGRAYVNGALLYLLLGKGAAAATAGGERFPQPVFDMQLDLNDKAVSANTATLVVHGIKFGNWTQTIPEEGFVMENLMFRALRIDILDTIGKPFSK